MQICGLLDFMNFNRAMKMATHDHMQLELLEFQAIPSVDSIGDEALEGVCLCLEKECLCLVGEGLCLQEECSCHEGAECL